jgi:hypothetical protein
MEPYDISLITGKRRGNPRGGREIPGEVRGILRERGELRGKKGIGGRRWKY